MSASSSESSITRLGRTLALVAGTLDTTTGVGLVFLPGLVLHLMSAEAPGTEALIYLRWVGAFVAAVGLSYLIALFQGGQARLRAVLEFTIVFRLAAGLFSSWALLRGWLSPAWISVPMTDFALAAAQLWLLKKGIGRDE